MQKPESKMVYPGMTFSKRGMHGCCTLELTAAAIT